VLDVELDVLAELIDDNEESEVEVDDVLSEDKLSDELVLLDDSEVSDVELEVLAELIDDSDVAELEVELSNGVDSEDTLETDRIELNELRI